MLLFSGALVGLDAGVSSPARGPSRAERQFISAGWYCPAPRVPEAEAVMSAANLGRRPVEVRRLAVGESSESVPNEADLRPRRRSSVVLGQLSPTKGLGLTEAFGSAIASSVSVVVSERGVGASQCLAEPGSTWLFAGGSTARRQDTYLLVGNPFREEAVIRVRVMDPGKELLPALLKDLVIPPLSQTSLFLAEYVPESASFGLEVTATQGRIVVSRYSQVATREGVKGVSLTPGIKRAELNWNFAGGRVPSEGEESILLVNPNSKEALVQIIFQTERDQVAAAPLDELPIPAGHQVRVKISDFLPRGTDHGTRVMSSNGVPIIAERETTAEVAGGRGFESVFGVPRPARSWAVGAGSSAGGSNLLAIVNHGKASAKVSISLLTEVPELRPAELQNIRIGADRRHTVDLTPYLSQQGATAVVTGSAPITVESLLILGPPYSDFAASHGDPID